MRSPCELYPKEAARFIAIGCKFLENDGQWNFVENDFTTVHPNRAHGYFFSAKTAAKITKKYGFTEKDWSFCFE